MPLKWDDHNFYQILEVPQNATQKDIEDAFRSAKATYTQSNPALYGMFTKDEAQQLMTLIEEAYSILSNPQMRKSYDHSRELKMNQSSPAFKQTQEIEFGADESESVIPEVESIGWDDGAINKNKSSQQVETIASPPPLPSVQKQDVDASKKRRTPYSSYTVDEEFESEIARTETFDGAFLKKVRLYKNVQLEHISENSRIGIAYLRSIEANDFVSLPAPVFVRGFVTQFAKVLQLDENKVATSFMKLHKSSLGQ